MSKLYIRIFLQTILLLVFINNVALAAKVKAANKYPILLEIVINQKKLSGIFTCYIDHENNIWVEESNLIDWHFPSIVDNPILLSGKKYYSLRWYKEVHYDLDRKKLKLLIWIPSQYLPAHTLNLSGYNPAIIRPEQAGLFLNYDLATIKDAHVKNLANSVLMELGLFQHYGVGTSSFLVSNYSPIHSTSSRYHFVRLDTTWTLDQPEKIVTWRFGDSITGVSSWSGAARFFGVQYATNFSTQPEFITFPLPGVKGEAIVPTNVQIFVNGVLNHKQVMENGAYFINNIPVVTGAGTVNVVTQDLLGRTQVVFLPYYASPLLLKAGLSNYSYEVGLFRQDYGINSNNYQHFLAVMTYLFGWNDLLTVGTHMELLSDQQTIGGSADYLIGKLGVISFAAAQSHSQFGGGWLGSAGFIRQTPKLNFGFKSTFMSSNYQQIGIQIAKSGPFGAIITNQVSFGYDTGLLGSFGLSYTVTKSFAVPNAVSNPGVGLSKLATVSYTRGVFSNTSLILSAIKDFHNAENNQIYASLIVSLDNVHNVNTFINYQNKLIKPGMLYSRNLPLGDGYGYHVLAATNGQNGSGADFTYQNEAGTYTGKAYRIFNENYYEADVSGALIYFDQSLFYSRRMTQSFALVQVPGFENVRVYYQNQMIGRTNQNGNLLIPDLLPYQDNVLVIEPRDLPLSAKINTMKRNALPYFRSGVIARFDVINSANILLKLIQKDGNFVPAGADVLIENVSYPVGYGGITLIPNLGLNTIQGKVMWNNKKCYFEISRRNNQFNSIRATDVQCSI